MDPEQLLSELKRNTILGHLDEDDEGYDGDMEGEPGVTELVDRAMAEEIPGKRILASLTSAMTEVGQKYESGEYMIPDMIAAAECVGTAMDQLEPYLKEGDIESKGRVVLATVEGDLHDIGKNIVATMLKGAGFEVKDIGIDVPDDKIVEAVREFDAQILGLSALLTTTMVKMESVIQKLKEAGLRDGIKVVIGGAPTSPEFAERIGADAYGNDAFDAIEQLRKLETAS